MTDGYVSSSEAARRLGVSKWTLLRAAQRGEIPVARRTPGGHIRFAPEDLAAYARRMEAARSAAGAAPPGERAGERGRDLAAGLARLAALDAGAEPERLAAELVALLAESLAVGAVLLARGEGDALRVAQVHDRAGWGLHRGRDLLAAEGGYGAALLAPDRPLLVADTRADPRFAALRLTGVLGLGAYVAVPVRYADGRPYGTLCALHPQPWAAEAGEVALLTLAGRTLMRAVERAEARVREERLGREAAARAAEFATLLEHLPCGVVVVDAEGRVELVNERGRRMGRTPLDLTQPLAAQAEAFAIRRSPDSPALTPAQTPIARALAGEAVPPSVAAVRWPGEDAERVMETAVTPLRDAAGGVRGAVAIFTDVTARARAEQALRARAERYRTIVETAGEGIVETDRAGRITALNAHLAQILGYAPEELVGTSLFALVDPRDRRATAAAWRRRREGIAESFEAHLRRKDGADLWVLIATHPLVDGTGAFDGSFALLTDITARKAAEEALRRREAFYRALVEDESALVGVVDAAGVYRYASPAHRSLLGYDPDALAGTALFDLLDRSSEEGAWLDARWADLCATPGGTARGVLRFRQADGSWRRVDSSVRVALGVAAIGGIVVTGRDMTGHTESEASPRQFGRPLMSFDFQKR